MLIARSPSAGTSRLTGSLNTIAPAAMVIETPPKEGARSDAGTIASPASRTAMCAAPIRSGAVPRLFVSRTRT